MTLVADFGLAFNQSVTATSTKHSSIGKNQLGTQLYKAPEACQPNQEWRTRMNDIYAFGFSIIELLLPERDSAYGPLLADTGNIMGLMFLKMQGAIPPLSDKPNHWNS